MDYNNNDITDEVGQRWGTLLNQALVRIISLERINAELNAKNQELQAKVEAQGNLSDDTKTPGE